LGSFEEGLQFIKRTRELHPERDYLTSIVAKFYAFQERYVEAEKELMRVRGIFEKSYQKALENDGVKKAIDDSDAAVLSDDELVSKYL